MKSMPDFVTHDRILDVNEAIGTLVSFFLGDSYEFSELLVGEKVYVFAHHGAVGVCHNGQTMPIAADNAVCGMLARNGMDDAYARFEQHLTKPFVIEGTLAGEGIMGNPYDLLGTKLFVHEIYDIEAKRKTSPVERQWFVNTFNSSPLVREPLVFAPSTIYQTPFAPAAAALQARGGLRSLSAVSSVEADTLHDLKSMATGISTMYPTGNRAGLLVRSVNNNFTFQIDAEGT